MKNYLQLLLLWMWLLPVPIIGQNLTFSAARGFYDTPFQLTISSNIAGGTIRYTTNGTAPTTSTGTVYSGQITINTTTVVRAIAYNSGGTATAVITQSYLFLNDVIHQPANIPGWPNHKYELGAGTATATHDYEMDPNVVNNPAYKNDVKQGLTSIPTMSIVLDKNEFWDLYEGETTFPASIEILYPDKTNEQFNCGLEAHSHNRLKRSLKLNIKSSITSNIFKKAPQNGANAATTFKDTKIVLRAGNNRSWARNWNPDRTAYTRDEWYRSSQQAISGIGGRGTFVHLYINGLYWGLYNPVERVDGGMLSEYYGGSYDDWMALDHDGIRSGDPTRFNYLTNTLIKKDMTNSANYAQLKEYLDVAKFCDYLIVTWMTGMTDWPGNNFHGGNRNNPPEPFAYFTWDCEWSWDTTNGSNQGAWVHPEFRNNQSGTATIAKIWHSARRNPEFMQLFADRVYKACFNNGGLTDEASRARWALLNNYIKTAIVDESARWGDALEDGKTRTRDAYWTPEVNRVDGLMNGNVNRFINALVAQGYYPAIKPPAFNKESSTVNLGFQLTMSNPNNGGTIYYTTDGTDPRATGGGLAPNAKAYSGPIAINGPVTVKARIKNGSTWSGLHEGSYTLTNFQAGLFINEFLASNSKLPDEFGEFDDWIEIYNSGSKAVNIGGMYITDNLGDLTQWQIPTTNPNLTTIPAKGFLLLWADGQTTQGPLHVNPKLSKGGEQIALSQTVGGNVVILDSLTFGAQADDISMGRSPDGSSTFKSFAVPTPGSSNVVTFKTGLYINEFLAVNKASISDENGEHDGWIEIYNGNSVATDIGGLYLTNALNNPSLWKIPENKPSQTTIPANGFIILWADNQMAQGPLHLGFKLNTSGGQIGLAEISGAEMAYIDSTHYSKQTVDVSTGRYPDGGKSFKTFSSPTPGKPNLLPAITNIFINEFLASNEADLADEFGEHDDWIELYNANSNPVDIGGLYITDDLASANKYQIPTTRPDLTTISAKGFLLLWADGQIDQGVLHVSIKLSAGGEQIGLAQINGTKVTVIDALTFDAQTTDVSMGRSTDGGGSFVAFTKTTPGASNGGTPPTGIQIIGFTLVDATTDQDIMEIKDGDKINVNNLPTLKLNIRANTSPATVGSVGFSLTGPLSTTKTENVAPYALFGDSNGDYAPQTFKPGSYKLSATPYESAGLKGKVGPTQTVAFELVNQPVGCANFSVSLTKVTDVNSCGGSDGSATVSVTGNIGNVTYSWSHDAKLHAATANNLVKGSYTVTASDGTCSATLNFSINEPALPNVTLSPFANVSVTAPAFALSGGSPAGGVYSGPGVSNGSFNPAIGVGTYTITYTYTNGKSCSNSATQTITVTPGSGGGIAIASFTLIDAITDQDIMEIKDGDKINVNNLPTLKLNIRANTSPASVGSVGFSLTGAIKKTQTENVAPYALFGDSNGDYSTQTFKTGTYKLVAIPYTGSGLKGKAGPTVTIAFTLVNQAANTSLAGARTSLPAGSQPIDTAIDDAVVYPNPVMDGRFTVQLGYLLEGKITYVLVAQTGTKMREGHLNIKEATSSMNFDFSDLGLKTAVYYLILSGEHLENPIRVSLINK